MKKDSALIEGKIDSKLMNSFDGEIEQLSEKEKKLAQKVIFEHRKEEEQKRKEKEAHKEKERKEKEIAKKRAEKEKKRKKKIKEKAIKFTEKFNLFSKEQKKMLYRFIASGHTVEHVKGVYNSYFKNTYVVEDNIAEFETKEIISMLERCYK